MNARNAVNWALQDGSEDDTVLCTYQVITSVSLGSSPVLQGFKALPSGAGGQVSSLVREIRPHVPWGAVKKIFLIKNKIKNQITLQCMLTAPQETREPSLFP